MSVGNVGGLEDCDQAALYHISVPNLSSQAIQKIVFRERDSTLIPHGRSSCADLIRIVSKTVLQLSSCLSPVYKLGRSFA